MRTVAAALRLSNAAEPTAGAVAVRGRRSLGAVSAANCHRSPWRLIVSSSVLVVVAGTGPAEDADGREKLRIELD